MEKSSVYESVMSENKGVEIFMMKIVQKKNEER